MSKNSNQVNLDAINWEILQLLAEKPRRPYRDISNKLQERGYDMTSEGIRYRVDKILDVMSIFFMVHPNEQDWEVMILLINVVNEPGAKESIADKIFGDEIWFVSRGFGSFDIYAIATAATNADIERLLTKIRNYDQVENIEYLIETERKLEVSNYFPIQDPV